MPDALEISERRRLEAQRLSGVGFWELNHQDGSLYWSEEIFAIYGLEADSLEPDYDIFASLIHDDDREWVEAAFRQSVETGDEYNIRYRIKTAAGEKWIEARGVLCVDGDGNPERSIGTAQDISEIIDAQQAAENLASHDALTGLPNRKLFSDRISHALKSAQRNSSKLGVLFIDLDHFKLINDRHGHDVGDEILVGVAQELENCARASDTFARIGGDEFVGLLTGIEQPGIDRAAERVKQAIEKTYKTRGGEFKITASIGVSVYPLDSLEPDELLRHADHAMYEAKQQGKSRICYFDTKQHQSNLCRQVLIQKIEHALKNDGFEMYYQPRIRLKNGMPGGAEALLRWSHDGESTSPAEVVEAISGTTLEWELDAWVIRSVMKATTVFAKNGLTGPTSLNINPSTIENAGLPTLLSGLLATTQSVGDDLEIEILERTSIRSLESTAGIIRECKRNGMSFSLDDFGTGYSSLSYFHALPVDKLKIDQRFIRSMLQDEASLALVKSILAIADASNRPVVAEGIENLTIARALKDLGCDYGQGFGLARPMPLDDYIAWAKAWDCSAFMDQVNAPPPAAGEP